MQVIIIISYQKTASLAILFDKAAAIFYNKYMITVQGDKLWRSGQEIGWVSGGEIFDHKGNRVGYFSDDAIYDSGYHKVAYIEGDTIKGGGQNLYTKDNKKYVSGGSLSDAARAAARVLFGD